MEAAKSPWSGEQILLLDEPRDWGLGDPSTPGDSVALRNLITVLVDDLEHLGDSVGKNYADSVLTVLQSLAQISLPASDPLKDQPLLRAERFTVDEFRRKLENADSLIQFDKLIAYFLHRDTSINVSNMIIAVGNPNYFYRLGNLLRGLRDDDQKKYLEFCIIRKFAPYYSAKSRRDLLRHAARMRGQEHSEEDWLPCLRMLRSPGLNAIFYREMQPRLLLHPVEGTLVPLLKTAFVELVAQADGLSQLAKDAIAEKVNAMKIIVGYSPAHLQQAYLDAYFRDWNGSSNQTLLQMVSEWTRFQQTKVQARLLRNLYIIEESLDITSVHPKYHAAENTVFLPAAFFQWPFHLWDNTMPYYLKFGIIGTAIATEMARGFDSVGSRWLPPARLASGWRPTGGGGEPLLLLQPDTEDCLRAQLVVAGAESVPPSPVQIREAFAAVWGLGAAERAHRLHLARRTSDRRPQLGLPSLSYSAEELLFIAFAQAHCGIERPELRNRLVRSYLPLKTRVHLSVQSSAMFRQAFRCKETAASRCRSVP